MVFGTDDGSISNFDCFEAVGASGGSVDALQASLQREPRRGATFGHPSSPGLQLATTTTTVRSNLAKERRSKEKINKTLKGCVHLAASSISIASSSTSQTLNVY